MKRYTDVDQKYLNALNMGLWNYCQQKKGEGGGLYLLQHDRKVNRTAEQKKVAKGHITRPFFTQLH